MTRREAEKLLGGHAPGILTEAERRQLYEAALADQALFDALADEEALRELLADPAARTELLAALRPARRPVPLWRRPGVLGVAAGLLVAGLAGLAVLHGPGQGRVPALQEPAAAPAPAAPAPAPPAAGAVAAPAPVRSRPKAAAAAPPEALPAPRPIPAPAAPEASAPAPGVPAAGRSVQAERVQAERVQAEDQARKVQENLAGARAGAAVVEVVPREAAAPAKTARRAPAAPVWRATRLADGTLEVEVTAPAGSEVLLLRRAPAVTVFRLPSAAPGQWGGRIPVTDGQAVDLYVLPGPVADPAGLPETGPVAGFRARIHPVPGER